MLPQTGGMCAEWTLDRTPIHTAVFDTIRNVKKPIGLPLVLVSLVVDYLEVLTGQRGKSGREFPPRNTHMTFIIARQHNDVWRIIYFRAADAREFVNRTRARDSANVTR